MLTTLRTHPHIDIVNISAGKSLVAVKTVKGRDGSFSISYDNATVGSVYVVIGTIYGGEIKATGLDTLLRGVDGYGTKGGVFIGVANSKDIKLTNYYGGGGSGWAYIYELR